MKATPRRLAFMVLALVLLGITGAWALVHVSLVRPRPAALTLPVPFPEAPTELWAAGMDRLAHGDRTSAARLFQKIMEAPQAEPALRRRAMFRLAEVQLALGDTVTPRAALSELVHGPDRMLGFDAALLLERCLPEARAAVWEAYLANPPDEPMRTQALIRQRAALAASARAAQ